MRGHGNIIASGGSRSSERTAEMKDEQAKAIEALKVAIQMEVEGKEFYQQASQKSDNRLVKELFENLAGEEDIHRQKFEEIYESIRKGQDWPDVALPSGEAKGLKSIFAQATQEMGDKIKIGESELQAIKVAMDMEIRTYNLYNSRSEKSTLPAEKRFYQSLAGEERGHHLALLDSYEYLTDPAGWFLAKEHRLDGI